MALRIEVDARRCIATKACVNAAGRVFSVASGLSRVVDPTGDPDDDIVRAAEACPVAAITVYRDGERLA